MTSTATDGLTARSPRRRAAVAILVALALVAGISWTATNSVRTRPFVACPADIAEYTGPCAVGTELYRYEDGEVCGRGSILNGEQHWLDGGLCL